MRNRIFELGELERRYFQLYIIVKRKTYKEMRKFRIVLQHIVKYFIYAMTVVSMINVMMHDNDASDSGMVWLGIGIVFLIATVLVMTMGVDKSDDKE